MVDVLLLLTPGSVVGNRKDERGSVTHNLSLANDAFLLNCDFDKEKVTGRGFRCKQNVLDNLSCELEYTITVTCVGSSINYVIFLLTVAVKEI